MATKLEVSNTFFHSKGACQHFTKATFDHCNIAFLKSWFHHSNKECGELQQQSMLILNHSSAAYLSIYSNISIAKKQQKRHTEKPKTVECVRCIMCWHDLAISCDVINSLKTKDQNPPIIIISIIIIIITAILIMTLCYQSQWRSCRKEQSHSFLLHRLQGIWLTCQYLHKGTDTTQGKVWTVSKIWYGLGWLCFNLMVNPVSVGALTKAYLDLACSNRSIIEVHNCSSGLLVALKGHHGLSSWQAFLIKL